MNPTNRYSRYYTYIKPVVNSQIVKTYGAYTLSVITMIIFIVFAIKPTVQTISALQKNLENSREVLQKVNQKVQNLQAGRQNFQNLGTNTHSKIPLALPTQVSLKSLIEPLELAANTNQASISALQIEPVAISQKDPDATSTTLDSIKFTFNTEGNFNNLLRVLQAIQVSGRLISIESVILNKAPDSSTILMSVTGKAYYLK